MSEMSEKLEAYHPPSTQTPARRTLKTLSPCAGYVILSRNPRGEVDWCRVDMMESHAFWRRIQPGADGLFELEEVRSVE